MSQYRYEALRSSRAIRLLKFTHEAGSEPRCKVITVEVEKAPPFVALSYTWGAKGYSRTICVDDATLAITTNLGEAIDAISPFAMERRMMFWADSICINQADIDERSRQVRLMNLIYRSAEMVVIWLGMAAHESDLAFDMMKTWSARFEEITRQHSSSYAITTTRISPDDTFFFGSSGSTEERAHNALQEIARRPWWTRAWVVQEGAIAHPSRTLLFCGDRRIDWSVLRSTLWVRTMNNSSNTADDFMMITLDTVRHEREYGVNLPLLRLLRVMRSYNCEDPRDKLYAALGMAMDVHENDIVPDYTKTVVQVYTDIVRYCVSNTRRLPLEFLSLVVRSAPDTVFEHDHVPLLPSWVPDWTIKAPTGTSSVSKAFLASRKAIFM